MGDDTVDIPRSDSPALGSGEDAGPSHKRGPSRRDALAQAGDVYERLTKDSAGTLPVSMVPQFLQDLGLEHQPRLVESVMEPGKTELTLDDSLFLVRMVAPSSPSGSTRSSWSSLAKAPLKKVLTKNRAYMESGTLVVDETVMAYMAKLEEHRKKCEAEGRYAEAKAAAMRSADLKTAQVERLRIELVSNQRRELEDVNSVYADECKKFEHMWERRLSEYDNNFARSIEELKASQEKAFKAYEEEVETKRPTKPKPSRDYLNQKKIEESLVKVKLYEEASQVKSATEEMYQSELEQAQVAFEAETRLKLVKFQSKQAIDLEALLQRGQRGRDELHLRRVSETEKRDNRFRNIVTELESLHRLEVVHLENWADGQVLAGKAVPLKDGFRRKREALLSTDF